MLSALVPRGQVEGLRELAAAHDRSVSAEVRQALRDHLGAAQEASPPSPVTRTGAAPAQATPRPYTPDDAAA
jgi:plasmid stability protein